MRITWFAIALSVYCKGPPQAPSFNQDERKRITRKVFLEYEAKHGEKYNKYLPERQMGDNLRVMTWNTHMLLNLAEEVSVVDENLNVIKTINADVLILQEIPNIDIDRHQLLKDGLTKIGHKHQIYRRSGSDDAILGIMIASRFPLQFMHKLELGNRRIALSVSLRTPSDEYVVIGTHLEVSDKEIRRAQVDNIAHYIISNRLKNVMLAGDFNSQWTSSSINGLKFSQYMYEVFRNIDWDHPEYTCWSGAEIDYIWIDEGLIDHIDGAYVYHSSVSDHLPLIMDINHDNVYLREEYKFVLFVVLLLIIICLLAYLCLPTSAWNNSYTALRSYDYFD